MLYFIVKQISDFLPLITIHQSQSRKETAMAFNKRNLIPLIESYYHTFTPLERTIADFFIQNTEEQDFSSKHISSLLYVSEASLSRFSQKCGFHGYREFIYEYKQNLAPEPDSLPSFSISEFNTYQELLNKTNALLDKAQILRITRLLSSKSRVYVYGRGSSGLVAQEMKLRFIRIGLNIEAITDSHVMKMNSVILDKTCLVIGISVSGQTPDITSALRAAKSKGATTLLMTARQDKVYQEFCDEILIFASKEHLERGNIISPQFPILLMLDVLYSRYLQIDRKKKEALHEYTMQSLLDSL